MIRFDFGDTAYIDFVFQDDAGAVGLPTSARIIVQRGDVPVEYGYNIAGVTHPELTVVPGEGRITLAYLCDWAGVTNIRAKSEGIFKSEEPVVLFVEPSNIIDTIEKRDDETGLLYFPHYLNPGSLITVEDDYYSLSLDDINYGELTDVMSTRELIQLSTDHVSKDRADRDVLLGAIEAAESEFDSYISSRYTIPVRNAAGQIPREAKNKVKILFKFFLYSRRPNMPPDVGSGYNDVLDFLKSVSRGMATIPELEIENGVATQVVERGRALVGTVYRSTTNWGSRRASDYAGRNTSRGFDHPGNELD